MRNLKTGAKVSGPKKSNTETQNDELTRLFLDINSQSLTFKGSNTIISTQQNFIKRTKTLQNAAAITDNMASELIKQQLSLLPSNNSMLDHINNILTKTISKRFEKQYQPTDLTEDQYSRLRYRASLNTEFNWMPLDMQFGFSLYDSLLPCEDKQELRRILNTPGIRSFASKLDLQVKLRAIGGIYKKFQRQYYNGNWKYFVDMQTMSDFAEKPPIQKFTVNVDKWVRGTVEHLILSDETLFYSLFEKGMDEFFNNAPTTNTLQHPEVYYMKQSFVLDPAFWARSGASDSKRLPIIMDGKLKTADKTKWATALAITPHEILAHLNEPSEQSIVAFVKLERMKARAIAMGDLKMYNKMTFIGNVLDELLQGHPNTTLYMRPKQVVNLFSNMASQTKDNYGVFMPVDQDEFDHNVNLRMIHIANKCITKFLISKLDKYPDLLVELISVMNLIDHDIRTAKVHVGDKVLEYQKGILSGWRFTALYDTLINAAEFYAFNAYLRQTQGMDAIIGNNVVFQGDDIRMWCSSAASAVGLWSLYTNAKFGVNPGKFFIKQDCDEYLRQVGEPGVCCGYPARAVGSIIFASPLARPKHIGEERFNDVAANWLTLLGRFYKCPNNGLDLMVDDLSRANNIKRQEVVRILYTPASLGGFGLRDGVEINILQKGLVVTPSTRQNKYKLASASAPLAEALSGKFKLNPETLTEMWSKSITKRGGTQMEQSFELKEIAIPLPINTATWQQTLIQSKGGYPLQPTPKPELLPSVLRYLQETSDNPEVWMDQQSVEVMRYLSSRTSRHVVDLWVKGKLPFNPPKVVGYSGLQISVVHKQLARAWWNWCCTRSKFTLSTVTRAALAVEILTYKSLILNTEVYNIRVGP